MAIETVRTVLVANSAVTALVPEDRITAIIRPQSLPIPAITLQRVSDVPVGFLIGTGELDSNNVQLDIWTDDYAQARAIADACRVALTQYLLTFESDGYEPDLDPDLYRVTQNWSVWT